MNPPHLSDASLASMQQEKEEELRRLQKLRVEAAAKTQRQREAELAEEREKLAKLAEDFRYNLELLEERDRDLDALADLTERLKAELLARDVEISDVRVALETERERVASAETTIEDTKKSLHSRIRSIQEDSDREKRSTETKMSKEREEMDSMRKRLTLRFDEMEAALDLQRRQMTQSFEEASKRQDHESRTKTDSLEAEILSRDLRERQLRYEVELLRGNLDAKESEEDRRIEERETRLREKDIEISELKSQLSVQESRVKELELLFRKSEADSRAQSEEDERKRNSLSRQLLERDGQLEAAKRILDERLGEEEGKIIELEAKIEAMERERREDEWIKEDRLKKKEEEIEDLKRNAEKRSKEVEAKIIDGMSERSGELKRTKDYLKKILSERDRAREDLDWYKRELASTGSRVEEMEKAKAQLELDLEARVDDVRRKEILRNEDLIRSLTKQRDDASAQLEESRTRFRVHRMNAGGDHFDLEENNNDDVMVLRNENERLKSVIRQMREQSEMMLQEQEEELEEQQHQVQQQQPQQQSDAPNDADKLLPPPQIGGLTPDYVAFLENEVRRLKKENKDFSEKIELIKGAATATRRSLPVCACAGQSNKRSGIGYQNKSVSKTSHKSLPENFRPNDDVGNELWSIVQRQKAQIEQLQKESKSSSGSLKKKLKEAVSVIRNLVAQKHQLIDANNRLEAEVKTLRQTDEKLEKKGVTQQQQQQQFSPEKAERMQYRLTKEQLQFAATSKTHLLALEEEEEEEFETEKVKIDEARNLPGNHAPSQPTAANSLAKASMKSTAPTTSTPITSAPTTSTPITSAPTTSTPTITAPTKTITTTTSTSSSHLQTKQPTLDQVAPINVAGSTAPKVPRPQPKAGQQGDQTNKKNVNKVNVVASRSSANTPLNGKVQVNVVRNGSGDRVKSKTSGQNIADVRKSKPSVSHSTQNIADVRKSKPSVSHSTQNPIKSLENRFLPPTKNSVKSKSNENRFLPPHLSPPHPPPPPPFHPHHSSSSLPDDGIPLSRFEQPERDLPPQSVAHSSSFHTLSMSTSTADGNLSDGNHDIPTDSSVTGQSSIQDVWNILKDSI